MRRRLLNFLTALSLLLCVAACVLWVRSYSAQDAAFAVRDRVSADGYKRTEYRLVSVAGRLIVYVNSQDFRPLPPGVARQAADEYRRASRTWGFASQPPLSPPYMPPGNAGWWGRRGFFTSHFGAAQTPTIYNDYRQFAAPHGSVVAAAALLPALWGADRWRSTRRRRRQLAGLCPRCGYDLRATPGRCPECGTATVTTPA